MFSLAFADSVGGLNRGFKRLTAAGSHAECHLQDFPVTLPECGE
jgi:hypothetical protein